VSSDNRRAHLIERAAARLRETVEPRAKASPPDGAAVAAAKVREVSGIAWEESPPAKREPSVRIDDIALKKGGLIDWDRPGDRIAEEFRIAQSNLLRQTRGGNGAAAARAGNLVMITSALKGEGKSFTSVNIAAGIAREGAWRVLLVDAVSGSGGLGRTFALSAAPGLFDLCCEGRLEIGEVIVPTAIPNLDFLPLGNGGAAGTVSRARMTEVIGDIDRRYSDRLIIIDTPPCLVSSDAHTLAATVGQTVLVVAAGFTQQGDVEAALGLLRACPVVSLLLNKVRPWNAHSFRSYGYLPAET
jgi:protein-tyrosine kinase